MNGYEIYLQMQYLKQEIQNFNEVIMALDHDHPNVQYFTGLLEKSEHELDQLMDMDQLRDLGVVEQF